MRSVGSTQAPKKARSSDFLGRFREIVSDPLSLLIDRHPAAGTIEDGLLCLHNGIRVPASGDGAYYGSFSDILVINRGVHEPLEEFIFQALIQRLQAAPVMLELGAYWGHYSMWLKQRHPGAQVHLVEPDEDRLRVGRANFALNGLEGIFTSEFVARGRLEVDDYLRMAKLAHLDVLHADIQGYEAEMIEGASDHLAGRRIDWVLVSTHSQALHSSVSDALRGYGYRIEVSSDFDVETTSFDGFVLASSPLVRPLLPGFRPMSRTAIAQSTSADLVAYVSEVAKIYTSACDHCA